MGDSISHPHLTPKPTSTQNHTPQYLAEQDTLGVALPRGNRAEHRGHFSRLIMGICIFCTNPANSKEDMFPQWILRRVKTGEPMVHRKPNRPVKISQSSKVRLKCVCATCNNGWMSALEQKCIPLIGALLEDIELWRDEEYQNLLSRWAVKTAMINDSVQSHTRFFTSAECESLKNKQEIPFGTQVLRWPFHRTRSGRKRE